MLSSRESLAALALVLLFGCKGAAAEDPDLDALSRISTEGSTASLRSGEEGHLLITIQPLGDAHVSDESPLRVTLGGHDIQWQKPSLDRGDLKPSAAKVRYPVPRFDAVFKAGKGPAAVVEANVVFFLCTKDLCARRQQTVKLPVAIKPAS